MIILTIDGDYIVIIEGDLSLTPWAKTHNFTPLTIPMEPYGPRIAM